MMRLITQRTSQRNSRRQRLGTSRDERQLSLKRSKASKIENEMPNLILARRPLTIDEYTEQEIAWFKSLLETVKAGDTETAAESIEGAIAVLERRKEVEYVN